mgnify:CR=1 FL=1
MHYLASYSRKAQLQIQEMAFVLVAFLVLFALAGLLYFTFRISFINTDADTLREDEAKAITQKIAGTPEFSWGAYDCASCIDLDKAFIIKYRQNYENFWGLDYLAFEKILESGGECNKENYPACKKITLINKTSDYGAVSAAFVTLCHWEPDKGGYVLCELGRVYTSGVNVQ